MERKGFILRPKFVFIDGRTGATMYSESYREEILYNAQQNTPALSSYFELMDRLVPNFLSALSSQKIRGTRVPPASSGPAARSPSNPLHLNVLAGILPPLHRCQDMYAIIQTGGHQIKVTPGGSRHRRGHGRRARRRADARPGAARRKRRRRNRSPARRLSPTPASSAVVEGETRGPKIRVFKKKRRKGMRRTKGHRAVYTHVRIKDILL